MSIRILIADDHAVFRSGLRAVLEQEDDFEVIGEAGNGLDAAKLAEEHDFDVLLLDISMPGISGARTVELVLANKPKAAIVILTMHEDEYHLQELFRVGVKAYVLKKSTGTELVQAVHSVCRGHTYIDPSLANLLVAPYVGKPASKEQTRVDILTAREQEVCSEVAYGFTNAEIAEKFSVSVRTIETHRTNIMAKLELQNRAELVRFALENGLMGTD